MNDREFLELAAKAAGIEGLFWSEIHDTFFYSDKYDSGSEFQPDAVWNPLTDDGDALRLAVKLNISVLRPVNGDNPEHFGTYAMLPDQSDCGKVRDGADPDAATRRAIVRAAAEIGKAMP